MTATEHVILVDESNNPIGISEKIAAHRQGLCHRAFSVFIFRHHTQLELLLQQRAGHKYHSPGLWTNTCCSHPSPGEDTVAAGQRRLIEEMGIKASLNEAGVFHYIAHFANGLTENEVDHVLIGMLTQENFVTNPDEVSDHRWMTLPDLTEEMAQYPDRFTPWLKQALEIAERGLANANLG